MNKNKRLYGYSQNFSCNLEHDLETEIYGAVKCHYSLGLFSYENHSIYLNHHNGIANPYFYKGDGFGYGFEK